MDIRFVRNFGSLTLKRVLLLIPVIIAAGLLIPEDAIMPVSGASAADWNESSFWYEPWGSSGTHKGIDIFGAKGTAVLSATPALVLFSGKRSKGGNVVAKLGPKWRIHYYAHLDSTSVRAGQFLSHKQALGTLGDSGNAAGKPPHLHYSILSILPIPWLATTQTQGWKRMFYLDPGVVISGPKFSR